MDIRLVDNKQEWEEFVLNYHPNSLLQAWNWGEFAQKQGRKIFCLGLFDGGSLAGAALLTKVTSRRADYLECHGGPLVDWEKPEVLDRLLEYLKVLTGKENAHFLRIRPPVFYHQKWLELFRQRGFARAPMYFQAEHTLHLDLTQSEEKLLANMRKNTRYGIRRAKREGVKISFYSKELNPTGLEEALQGFFGLYQKTVQRQNFVPYDYKYFENEVGSFWEDDQVVIFLAKWQGQVVAAAIVLFYGDFAYYHHGASVHTQPDVFASYALQWAAIKEARQRGLEKYDFWGVAPKGSSRDHPRAGLTFFKEGFGGKPVRWMTTMDLPIKPWRYWPMYAFVKYERWKRGL